MPRLIPMNPGTKHFSITPDDNNDMAIRPRALHIGKKGTISIVDENGTEVIYTLDAGIFPFGATRVKATGTSATDIVGLY